MDHSYRGGTIKNVMLRDNDDEDGLCCWLLFHSWSLGMDDLMDLRKGGVQLDGVHTSGLKSSSLVAIMRKNVFHVLMAQNSFN